MKNDHIRDIVSKSLDESGFKEIYGKIDIIKFDINSCLVKFRNITLEIVFDNRDNSFDTFFKFDSSNELSLPFFRTSTLRRIMFNEESELYRIRCDSQNKNLSNQLVHLHELLQFMKINSINERDAYFFIEGYNTAYTDQYT